MNILYLLHFNAPMGGLHENLYSSALFMNNNNQNVWIVIKEGPLAERLRHNGVNTIIVDYKYISETLNAIRNTNVDFDIVHTHPGLSRKAALHISKEFDIPLVMTFHGMWADSLHLYHDRINSIICVSEGIKDYIKTQTENIGDKCYVIPNGYNDKLFTNLISFDPTQKNLNIGLVTRLDEDKSFILDIFLIALKYLKDYEEFTFTFKIIGTGKKQDEFLQSCKDLLNGTKHRIEFTGWLVDESLIKAYSECDIIFAPGRSAIESMASGKPTIAVGSKKFIGLIKHDNWKKGVYNNFGGYGNKFKDYINGSLETDLDFLLSDTTNINLVGDFSYQIATNYYPDSSLNQNLLTIYETLVLEDTLRKRYLKA
ncbi:glycosyltransferase [Jeotgalicoccus sp. ATCC 8456]|uniref:glycosyltransferase n=1 Tax=Jeotgalicoccus sp. ATCC 8456 TaxID=946435 RepID=UPI0018E60C18|nr:glycosyltransferase [Jeotgalicoccus sp. ATCC 8456]QQD85662.1 glycosyltransferase [Jeotgalicoccus sp. ATCC 8456]